MRHAGRVKNIKIDIESFFEGLMVYRNWGNLLVIGYILIGGIGFENLDLPIVGSKIKIVVNLSVTYQNLSGEK